MLLTATILVLVSPFAPALPLYTSAGGPSEVSTPDMAGDCYLGQWGGAERRLVHEEAQEVPFFRGKPGGHLEASGNVTVEPGTWVAPEDVTVRVAPKVRVTQACDVGDPGETLRLEPGDTYYALGCSEGSCRVEVGGQQYWAFEGDCVGERAPEAPSPETGWWVPYVRAGVPGWIPADEAHWHVEVRCVGPDDGADMSLAAWHRFS